MAWRLAQYSNLASQRNSVQEAERQLERRIQDWEIDRWIDGINQEYALRIVSLQRSKPGFPWQVRLKSDHSYQLVVASGRLLPADRHNGFAATEEVVFSRVPLPPIDSGPKGILTIVFLLHSKEVVIENHAKNSRVVHPLNFHPVFSDWFEGSSVGPTYGFNEHFGFMHDVPNILLSVGHQSYEYTQAEPRLVAWIEAVED